MNEPRKYEGYWWIPDQEYSVPGIAEYTPKDGVTLCVFNNFNRSEADINRIGQRSFNLIYGQTVNGKDITLKDNRERGERNGKPKYDTSTLFAGGHVEDEPRFDKLRLEFPLLTEWTGISGLSTSNSISDHEAASAGDMIQITHTRQEPIESQVNNLNITFSQNVNSSASWVGEATIEETTYIDLEQRDGQIAYEDCLYEAKMFQDLLTLGIGKSIFPRHMLGIDSSGNTQTTVEMLFYNTRRKSYSPPSDFTQHKANFVLDDISEDLEPALSEWINAYKELQPLFNSYSAIFNHNYTVDDEYILLSRIFYIYYLVSRKSSSTLSNQLWPGSFDEILIEIIEDNSQIFANLNVDIRSSVEQIAERLRYYITYDDYRDIDFDQRRSFDLLMYLRISLIAVLCSEVGVDDERIAERLNRNYNAIE